MSSTNVLATMPLENAVLCALGEHTRPVSVDALRFYLAGVGHKTDDLRVVSDIVMALVSSGDAVGVPPDTFKVTPAGNEKCARLKAGIPLTKAAPQPAAGS